MIPRFFDEKGWLELVCATLRRASLRWRAVRFTEMEERQLEACIRLRRASGDIRAGLLCLRGGLDRRHTADGREGAAHEQVARATMKPSPA